MEESRRIILYYYQKLETALEILQIPGRLMPEMIKKIWDEIEKKVDMARYKPKVTAPFHGWKGYRECTLKRRT